MSRKSLMKDEKATHILEECVRLGYTDRRIQQELASECGYEWSLQSIRRSRIKTTGVKKVPGGQSSPVDTRPPLSVPPPGMPDDEKVSWFRDDFKKSHLYVALKKQLSEEEIDIYIEEYGRICCQFEDIVTSEFFQIDDFLKHRILISRQITAMRIIQQEIDQLTQWVSSNPITENMSAEERKNVVMTINTIGDKRSDIDTANTRYDKLCGERDKIEKKLNATRRDRLEQLAGGKETFMKLVASIQHSQAERDKHGKYAELTKLAAEDITDQFRKTTEFPDGQMDTIITDSESVNREEE